MTASSQFDFLFGMCAFRKQLVNENALASAFARWSETEESIAQILTDRGELSDANRQEIEDNLTQLLESFDGDVSAALGEILRDGFRAESRARFQSFLDAVMGRAGNATTSATRYAIEKMHAEGGLGRVWLAYDRWMDRNVALKELHTRFNNETLLQHRFAQEAKITGQLEHPNVVPVYERGVRPETGQPFYAMRFLKGRPLGEAIADCRNKGKSPAAVVAMSRLLAAFVSICKAVAYAHSRGIIHRDLKPENILLGEFGEVMVLDWGLAKVIDAAEDSLANVCVDSPAPTNRLATTVGSVVGTPGYMSPEQASGDQSRLGRHTDVYGLGAILYEILTGRAPHAPASNESFDSAIERIATAPAAKVRTIEPRAPAPLAAICDKAMAFAPSDRYRHVIDLANDIERYVAGEPVDAFPESYARRLARWINRRRGVAQVLFTGLVLIAVGGVSFVTYLYEHDRMLHLEKLRAVEDLTKSISVGVTNDLIHLNENVLLAAHSMRVLGIVRENAAKNAAGQKQLIDETVPRLEHAFGSYVCFDSIAIVDRAGKEIVKLQRDDNGAVKRVDDAALLDHRASDYFREAMTTPYDQSVTAAVGPRGNPRGCGSLAIAAPICLTPKEPPSGVIVVFLSPEKLVDESLETCRDAEVILTDETRRVHFTYTGDLSPALKDELDQVSAKDREAEEYEMGAMGSLRWMFIERKIHFPPAGNPRHLRLTIARLHPHLARRYPVVAALMVAAAALALLGCGLVVLRSQNAG